MIPSVEFSAYRSELLSIVGYAAEFPDRETGGDIYGLLSHSGAPTIMLATGPGPRAVGSAGEFQQDPRHLSQCQQELWADYGIQYLGGWHSHHRLGIPQPSGGDVGSIEAYAARRNRTFALEGIVTIEGDEVVLQFFHYQSALTATRSGYEHARVKELPTSSPFRDQLSSKFRWIDSTPNERRLPKWTLRQPGDRALRQGPHRPRGKSEVERPRPKWLKEVLKSLGAGPDVEFEVGPDFVQLEIPLAPQVEFVAVVDSMNSALLAAAVASDDSRSEPTDISDQLQALGFEPGDTKSLWNSLARIRERQYGGKRSRGKGHKSPERELVEMIAVVAAGGGDQYGME